MVVKFKELSLVWKVITGVIGGVLTLVTVAGAVVAFENRYLDTKEQANYDKVLHMELNSEFGKRDREIELLVAGQYEQHRAGIINQIRSYETQIQMIHNRAASEGRGINQYERSTINMLQQEISRLRMALRG